MVRLARLAGFVALLLWFSGCSWCTRPPATGDRRITLVYTTGVTGNIEPCGCSADQRGGTARAAAAIDRIRKEGHDVLLIDGGDRFYPATSASADPLAQSQQERQASTLADITRLMRYDAVVLGDRDQRADAHLFDGIPALDTGEAKPFTQSTLLRDIGGLRIGLFAVGNGDDARALVLKRAEELRSQDAQVIILLAYRTIEGAKQLLPTAKAAGVSLVLAGRAEVPETHESAALPDAQPPLFTVQARGQAILRLDILAGGSTGAPFVKITGQGERDAELDAIQQRIDQLRKDAMALPPTDPMAKLKTQKLLELEGRKARLAAAPPAKLPRGQNAFTYAFIPMTPDLPDDPTVRATITRYDTSVATDNLAYAKAHPKACPTADPEQATYIGAKACAECHQEAYNFWLTTPHSHAYEALASKNKQYNVSCIGCHVLGYQKPGGACDIAQTAGRENVQCESCHGPGSIHADSTDAADIRLHVSEVQCRTCHDPENSTHFNYVTYRTQILGPGHGM